MNEAFSGTKLRSHSPYTIPFRNDSGGEIPPYAVMRARYIGDTGERALVDREGQWVLRVLGQPNDDFQRKYYINGPTAVPDGGYSMCSDCSYPTTVYTEASTSSTQQGVQFGAVKDQWYLAENYPGGFSLFSYSATRDIDGVKNYAVFRQEDCNRIFAQSTAQVSDNGTDIEMNVCAGERGETEITTVKVTVNLHQDPGAGWYSGTDYTGTYPDDTKFICVYVNSVWQAIHANKPAND